MLVKKHTSNGSPLKTIDGGVTYTQTEPFNALSRTQRIGHLWRYLGMFPLHVANPINKLQLPTDSLRLLPKINS